MEESYVVIPNMFMADLISEGFSAEDNFVITALMLCVNEDGYTDITEKQLAEYLGLRRETVSRRIALLAKKEYDGEPIITKTNHRPSLIKISNKLGVVSKIVDPLYNREKYSEDRGAGYRSIIGYNSWKKAVKMRDGECLKCGSIENLVAHHIENFLENKSLRTEVTNGATLCKTCHISFHKRYGYRGTNGKQLEEYLRKE